jgi:hypothetical protein
MRYERGRNFGTLVKTPKKESMFDELERSISCFPIVDGVEDGIFPKINVLVKPTHELESSVYGLPPL